MFDEIGQIVKVIACKSNPEREFVFAEGKPGHIGIRSTDYHSRWWLTEKMIISEIEKRETELAFWREALQALEERPTDE